MSCYPTGFKKSSTRRRSSITGEDELFPDMKSTAMEWLERWSSKAANTFLDGLQCNVPANGSPSRSSPALTSWCPPDGEFGTGGGDMFLFQSNRDTSVLDDESSGSSDESTDSEDEEDDVYEFFHRQEAESSLLPMKFRSNQDVQEKLKTAEQKQSLIESNNETYDDMDSRSRSLQSCEPRGFQKRKPTLEVITEERHRKHQGSPGRDVAANSFETATTASLSASWSSSTGEGSNKNMANSHASYSPIALSECDSMLVNYDEHEEDAEVFDNRIRNDWGDKDSSNSIERDEWNNSSATKVLVSHIKKQRNHKLHSKHGASPLNLRSSPQSLHPEDGDGDSHSIYSQHQNSRVEKPPKYAMHYHNHSASAAVRQYDL